MAWIRARTLVKAPRRMGGRLRIEDKVSTWFSQFERIPLPGRPLPSRHIVACVKQVERPAPAANLVGAWALKASERIEVAMREAYGGSRSGMAALATIATFPGERSDAVGRVVGLSASGLVRAVDRLVGENLVRRVESTADGREVRLQATPRGRRATERLLAARAAAVTSLLQPLAPSERRRFLALLDKLLRGTASSRHEAREICRLCDHLACEGTVGCPVSQGAPGVAHRSQELRVKNGGGCS
jgi:MarR family transcriptional regulator, negative regulator of the multidrug operon emrRAB